MKWALAFMLMFFPQSTREADQPSGQPGCYMLRKKVLLHHETSTLIYISHMWREVKAQQNDKTVRNSTAEMLLQSLERMSHDWCDPSYTGISDKKTKRSLSAILATIFAFGSLIIGPAIAEVLEEISQNTKWRITEAKKELETARILVEFEKRLSASTRVEEILASIMLHESILSDLLQHSDSNRTWKKIFKHQIREFKELGFIDEEEEITLGREENLLPKGTYKFESSVHKNRDCGETNITIKAIGLIPGKTCFDLHKEQDKDKEYIRLHSDINNLCIFVGTDHTKLPGNKTFMTSNTIVGPCENENKLTFKSKENTLLVRPKSSRAYMTSTCGEKITRTILYHDQFYALPLKCTSWISTEKRRAVNEETDYFQSQEIFLSATTGRKITYHKNQPTLIFYAVESVKDLESKRQEITKVELNYVENFLDTFLDEERVWKETVKANKTKSKIVAALASILSLISIVVIIRIIRKKTELRLGPIVRYLRGEREKEYSVTITRRETGANSHEKDKKDEEEQKRGKRRESSTNQEEEEKENTEDAEYETITFLPAKTTITKGENTIKPISTQKEQAEAEELETTKTRKYDHSNALEKSTKDQDVPRRTHDKKEDITKRRNREARIYYEGVAKRERKEEESEEETEYENKNFLQGKHIAIVHRKLDEETDNMKKSSDKDWEETKDGNLETIGVLQTRECDRSEKLIKEEDKERDPEIVVWDDTVDISGNPKSENTLNKKESEIKAKNQDIATGSNIEPLYDVPRKLYNRKTKVYHESAGDMELHTYSDDLVVRWAMPTEKNNDNSNITESTNEKRGENRRNHEKDSSDSKEQKNNNNIHKDDDAEKSPSRGSLHARLMKELDERFRAMKIEHDIK